MKIKELIEELKKYDGDTEICARSSEEYMSTSDIDIDLLDDGRLFIYGY